MRELELTDDEQDVLRLIDLIRGVDGLGAE